MTMAANPANPFIPYELRTISFPAISRCFDGLLIMWHSLGIVLQKIRHSLVDDLVVIILAFFWTKVPMIMTFPSVLASLTMHHLLPKPLLPFKIFIGLTTTT